MNAAPGVPPEEADEIFTLHACRCRRCNGILISAYGLRHHMGAHCRKIVREETASRTVGGQTTVPGFVFGEE